MGPERAWGRERERVEVVEEGEEREVEPPFPLTERETEEKLAGVVPVPVAAIIEGSAWRRSHSMVWPSDL